MAIQIHETIKNAMLNSIEATIGTTPTLLIYSGSAPALITDAPTGTEIVIMELPSNWLNNASSGTKTLTGTWQITADNAGTAGYFRIYDTSPAQHIQGTVTATGGGGDITLDNIVIAAGQTVTITTFSLAAGNT
jgi:hypothetical protein